MTELARLEVERRGLQTVVGIHGEVDMSNAGELGAAISAAVPNGTRELVVDLTGTTYLDSVGISLLLRLAARLGSRRQTLRVVVPAETPIRAVLELAGVPEVIDVRDAVEPAALDGQR
ncbi:MAG: STAS domain-containing protein [Actinomycetota bacterium]